MGIHGRRIGPGHIDRYRIAERDRAPGPIGGMRGLVHVRAILSGMGVLVVPGDLAVGKGFEVFAEDGSLADERLAGRLTNLIGTLVSTTSALSESG